MNPFKLNWLSVDNVFCEIDGEKNVKKTKTHREYRKKQIKTADEIGFLFHEPSTNATHDDD